jgi:hypothetical protein
MMVQSFAVSVFIFLFLFIFQPFDISSKPYEHVLNLSVMYSLITLLSSLTITLATPFLFSSVFVDIKWNVLKEITFICLIVLVISFINYYASIQYYLHYKIDPIIYEQSSLPPFIKAVFYTFSIAIIPCIILVMFNQYRLLKKAIKESEIINHSLKNKVGQKSDIRVSISGEGKNELLQINIKDFLFARASANYSEVFHMDDNGLKKILLRSSMNNLEDQLINYKTVERVHRGYLVNLNNVINVTGNAQGYRLHFKQSDEFVPVSRKNSTVVKSKLVT